MSENFSGCGRLAAAFLFAVTIAVDLIASPPGGQSLDFRDDWRFAKGEQPGAEAPAFDDSSWAAVRLPHDWAIAGPFNPGEDGSTGKLPWRGIGWYRKSFTLDREPGDRVYLDFDGVMAFPKVYVNGKLAGEWDYGYTSFRIDATPYVKLKGSNVVAVRVDTTRHRSRWYPGAGIYRKVTLQLRNPIHIAHWGTFVTTPHLGDNVAEVNVRSTIENHTNADAKIAVLFTIRGPDGAEKIGFGDRYTVSARRSIDIESSTSLIDYERWGIYHPALYTLETAVMPQKALSGIEPDHSNDFDRETTKFGIREFNITADDGFHLNGRRVQLYGVNLHHDHGPLGAAFYARAMERQLEIMREMGANAIRTSHNAPAPELLDLCDRMGFLVWDECFDKWDDTADRVDGKPSHEAHAKRHLRSMVMRDRNHPSVVVWSIGNEIPAGGEGVTPDRVRMMRDIVRRYDTTRPVGLGCHIPQQVDEGIFEDLDLTGWNYARRYARYRARYPDKPIVYSESASALSTRGFYELPLPTTKTDYSKQHQVSSYDFNAAPWSDIADAEFKLMQDDRFVAGEFVWTGFDYLGEPTPFERQAKSSYFGIVDLCGIPKDRYYLYRSYWRPETPTIHILPHWNWPERVGQNVPVFVYTNGDSTELFLNNRSLGFRRKGDVPERSPDVGNAESVESSYYDPTYAYRLRWNDVVYEPGELRAVAYMDGKEIGSATMKTAGPPATLRLSPDRERLEASGDDLCYILVESLDENGVPCPLADNRVQFTVRGPAEIVGVGNGDPLSIEPFQADRRRLFAGKAMLIVRTLRGQVGPIEISAASAGMAGATASCQATPEKRWSPSQLLKTDRNH